MSSAEQSSNVEATLGDQIRATMRKIKEEDDTRVRDDGLERKGLVTGRSGLKGYYKFRAGGPMPKLRTQDSLDKTPLPKFRLEGDVVLAGVGDAAALLLREDIVTRLSDEEGAAEVTLQQQHDLRVRQAAAAKLEATDAALTADWKRIDEVRRAAVEKLAAIEEGRRQNAEKIEAARETVEAFFDGKPPGWKEKALAEAARDRETPPRGTEPEVHFLPRPEGQKRYRWNSALRMAVEEL